LKKQLKCDGFLFFNLFGVCAITANGYSLAVSGDKKHNTFSQHKRKLNERNQILTNSPPLQQAIVSKSLFLAVLNLN